MSPRGEFVLRTDVEQNGAIKSLVDDMVLEDLIVQSLGTLGGRHC